MSLLEKASFLDALPVPCLHLTLDRSIIYANSLAHKLIHTSIDSQDDLAGCLLKDTDFVEAQLVDPHELGRAFNHLFRTSGRNSNSSPRYGAAGNEKDIVEASLSACANDQHTVRLSQAQRALSNATTHKKNWQWTLSLTTIGKEVSFCLIAHESVLPALQHDIKTGSQEREWEMLRNITRPSFEDYNHVAAISLHDMSMNLVNDRGHARYRSLSESFESSAQQLSETVWTEDFTRPFSFSETASHICLEAGKAQQGMMRGLQDDSTGLRSIVDLSVSVLNEPFGNKLLGCIMYARPVREWSEYILGYDTRAKLALGKTSNGEHAPMVRTMLLNGNADYFSPSWQRYSKRSLSDLCNGAWQDCIHPEDLSTLQQCTQVCFETGSRQELEVRYRTGTSGGYRYFTDTIAPWKDVNDITTRWYCISVDTHELISQRKASDLASQRLYRIIRDMDVVVHEIDSNYVFVDFQGSLEVRSLEGDDRKVTSYAGLQWDEGMQLVHAEDRAKYRQAVQDAMEGKSLKTTVDYRVGPKHLRNFFVPIRTDTEDSTGNASGHSNITGVLGLSMDLTTQHDNEQARVQIQAMTQASRLKDEFLANISHELRTPIAGIVGLLDLMIETDLNAEQLDMAHGLQTSAAGLLRLVNDLLDLSKVEAQAMPIEKMPFCITDILSEARRNYEALALAKGLRLDIRQLDHPCPTLLGDALRIRQILHNLLSNAIKFTQTGFVRLTTTHQLKGSTVEVIMVIHDSGIGITKASLAKLFQPFVQADQSTTRLYGGSGLGLIIARKLARAMNGDVNLQSVEGQGTVSTFSLTLEVHSEHISTVNDKDLNSTKSASQNNKLTSSDDSTTALSHIKILVVEDNTVNQKVITGRLRSIGITHISSAAHGGEAIAYMKALHEAEAGVSVPRPDMVLMDCQMPVLDGFETTRQLRSDFDYQRPIIALTASAVKGYRQQCLDAGMNDFLTKPFSKGELEAVLRSWLPSIQESHQDSH